MSFETLNQEVLGLNGHDYLNQKTACIYLRCSRTKFYHLRKRHGIPHYRHGQDLYFKRTDLDRYLESLRGMLPQK